MLLKRILGQMLTHMKRVVIKEWKYKVDNYDRQRALMTGFINRMMKSYLQKGWVTWEYYDKGAVAFRAKAEGPFICRKALLLWAIRCRGWTTS